MKPLQFVYAFLIAGSFFWRQSAFRDRRPEATPPGTPESVLGSKAMLDFQSGYFLVVPMGLGVVFLLWVLWNFWKDERRKSDSDRRQSSSANSVRIVRF
jgi:hypothetical protein